MSKEHIEREATCKDCFHYDVCANPCTKYYYRVPCRKFVNSADVEPVVHAYWTGKLSEDEACAEGLPTGVTEEERIEYLEWKNNLAHCSNCKGGYDGRKIHSIRYCHFCGARMDGGK